MVDRLANTEVNTKRMKSVEDCFGSTGQPLLKVGRVLVGEGVLTKLCRKKPKPRQFFLFNDILVYGNIVINKKMYNKQHILPLEEVKIVTLEDDGNFQNGWQIISPGKSFAVYAATPTEKAEWMAHIDKCIKDVIKKTGKKPSGDEAAVWVPDHSANICMVCKKTKFSPIVRRHHCRRCGSVVCGSCSNKKFLIPHISSKPVRVCNKCYDQMSSGKVNPEDPVPSEVTPVQQLKTDHSNSLTRHESDKIAESGSSAEESDDDDEGAANAKPTFYEDKTGPLPGEVTNDVSVHTAVAALADSDTPPSRPVDPPAATSPTGGHASSHSDSNSGGHTESHSSSYSVGHTESHSSSHSGGHSDSYSGGGGGGGGGSGGGGGGSSGGGGCSNDD